MASGRGRTAVLLAAAVLSTALGAGLPATGAVARPLPAAGWSAQTADPSSRYNVLTGVSADSASDAWAVGAYLNDVTGVRDTLILHWNGTAWSLR